MFVKKIPNSYLFCKNYIFVFQRNRISELYLLQFKTQL